MDRDFDSEFREAGFLSAASSDLTPVIRRESSRWFDLADRGSRLFHQIAIRAAEGQTGSTAGDPKVVTTLLAVRCASTVQGVILLAERGMLIEARTLVRGLIENALCLGALHDQPTEFLQALWKDAEASRKAQGNFILENGLVPEGGEQRALLEEAIAKIEKVRQLSIKDVSNQSPLRRLYLTYRVLSNDSAHPSARSLSRHLNTLPDRSGWTGYVIGPMGSDEVDNCLLLLLQGLTAAGVAVTQILGDAEGNAAMAEVSEDMRVLAAQRLDQAGEAS